MTDTLRAALLGGLVGGLAPIVFTFLMTVAKTGAMFRIKWFSKPYARQVAESLRMLSSLPPLRPLDRFLHELQYVELLVKAMEMDPWKPKTIHKKVVEANRKFLILYLKIRHAAESHNKSVSPGWTQMSDSQIDRLAKQAQELAADLEKSFGLRKE